MSGGYTYGSPEPTEKCPYCNAECVADYCDVGVGMVQCGPFHCECCGASEIGPYDKKRKLTNIEERTGWYAPNSEPGSSANVIAGQVVDHETMNWLYRARFKGQNPTSKEVQNWFASVRRKPSQNINILML